MEILTHRSFEKAYAKLDSRQRNLVNRAITLFMEDRSNPALRDHPLKGKLAGLRSFSASWDLRVIYREEGGFVTVILIDAGTHNQVY
jgi:addiction module RelE/StbE family toxin